MKAKSFAKVCWGVLAAGVAFAFMIGPSYAFTSKRQNEKEEFKDPNGEYLTFCKFGPKRRTFEADIDGSETSTSDHCTGSAKIQVLAWSCVEMLHVDKTEQNFLQNAIDIAKEECSKECENRTSHCQGRFDVPTKCGLLTSPEDAKILGTKERLGCRKDCDGQAFAFCSLYDLGFRTDDPEMLKMKAPNCHCFLVK